MPIQTKMYFFHFEPDETFSLKKYKKMARCRLQGNQGNCSLKEEGQTEYADTNQNVFFTLNFHLSKHHVTFGPYIFASLEKLKLSC